MLPKTCTDLATLTPDGFRQWLDSFDFVLTDCDGVIWENTFPIDGAAKALNTLRALGKRVFFVTNNSQITRADLQRKAASYGHENVQESDIITSASAAAAFLRQRNFTGRAYVIGLPSMGAELTAAGIRHCGIGPDSLGSESTALADLCNEHFVPDPEVGAVVVGFDEHFSFPKMFKAATYLDREGCWFVGTNRDERQLMGNGRQAPESGPMIASIETVAGRQCQLVGKPEPSICESLLEKNGGFVRPERTLMIGDRYDIDVQLGVNCGFKTLLVATGVHCREDVKRLGASELAEERVRVPDFYADGLQVVAEQLERMEK